LVLTAFQPSSPPCIFTGEVIRNLSQAFPGSFYLFLRSTGIEGLCVSATGVD
jgi:hypothetical protein